MLKRPFLAVLLVCGLAACDSDTDPATPDIVDDVSDASTDPSDDGSDATEDIGPDVADVSDAADAVDADALDVEPDTRPAVGSVPVPAPSGSLPEAVPGGGDVSVYAVEDDTELWDGMSVQARPGDWIIENESVRYVVEGADRTMSPCPFGGNVIDAFFVDGETRSDETLGEICPMVNLGLTFRPLTFDVLEDGSEGRAVLQVTGDVQRLDFLDIEAMAGGFLNGLELQIALEPNRVRPLTMTVTYALVPGDRALRVVTAFRNDGNAIEHVAIGHLLRPSGEGVFFNPLNSAGGYGYRSIGTDNLTATPVAFSAYTHETATWAYVPDPDATLDAALPVGVGSLSVTGVTASLYGTFDLIGTLLAQPGALSTTKGVFTLAPGDVSWVGHGFIAGDGSLASVIDAAYPLLSVPTATVGGVVRDGGGEPVGGVRVTAVDVDGRGMNQDVTDADGRYGMSVPADVEYEVRAYAPGRSGVAGELVTPTVGEEVTVDLDTVDPGTVRVQILDPTGEPVAGRMTVTCDGRCPRPLGAERDILVDDIPGDFAAVVPASTAGVAEAQLAPGTYRLTASRGMEWSTWPSDARTSGGFEFEVTSGGLVEVDAEIARVVNTAGTLSGDFHVHALASTDSSVANDDRIWSFVSDGLDVIVSTDHDYIVDHAPLIAELGLSEHLASFVGVETTTSSYGHINAFPLEVDAEHRFGGALDWGDGLNPTLPPSETYAWMHSYPGEQVVQINHAEGVGTISALGADVLLGISRRDAGQTGIAEQPGNPSLGDTGFWSDDFTAIELMNGFDRGAFWTRFRWWLTMLGRGFTPTGTAVTDTHKLYSDIGGVPRSYAWVSESTDTPATLDAAEYIAAVNSGRLLGTNGPFFTPSLHNTAGDVAMMGDTIVNDAGLELRVLIDTPEWMRVDTIDVYMNVQDDIYDPSGREHTDALAPTLSVPVELGADDLEVVATGTVEHRHYVTEVQIPLTVEDDAYVVVIVRAADPSLAGMWPVVPSRSQAPFAFSNPIFVDANGGGYNTWPLQALIDQRLSQKRVPTWVGPSVETGHHGHRHDVDLALDTLSRAWMAALFDRVNCNHAHAE